jgi:hypothetical protein
MSLRENVRPACAVHVLYATSNAEFRAAYQELFQELRGAGMEVIGVEQGTEGFASGLRRLLNMVDAPRVMPLVDDIVFTRSVDMDAMCSWDPRHYIPSIRLGRNIDWCPFRNRRQPHPAFTVESDGLLSWLWADGDGAWGYPMSLDGNIFLRTEMLAMARSIEFLTPNSFESRMAQVFGPWARLRRGVCYPQSRIVNMPWNRVQDEFANACGDVSPEYLLRQWRDGFRLDYRAVYGRLNTATHEDVPLAFARRDRVWKQVLSQ